MRANGQRNWEQTKAVAIRIGDTTVRDNRPECIHDVTLNQWVYALKLMFGKHQCLVYEVAYYKVCHHMVGKLS